eukprot:3548849-Prymnesium_polylepis.1
MRLEHDLHTGHNHAKSSYVMVEYSTTGKRGRAVLAPASARQLEELAASHRLILRRPAFAT